METENQEWRVNDSTAYIAVGGVDGRPASNHNPYDYPLINASKHFSVKNGWQPEFEKLVTPDINGVYFSSYEKVDLGLIAKLFPKDLRTLSISAPSILHSESLTEFSKLERLTLSTWKDHKFRFELPDGLKVFQTNWKKSFELQRLPQSLEYLSLDWANNVDVDRLLESTPALQKLELLDGKPKLSIASLAALQLLRYVSLTSCKSIVFDRSQHSNAALKFLDLEVVNIGDLSWLKSFPGLAVLTIHNCGELETFAALQHVKSLKGLWISGTTKSLDGDMSFVEKLPNLENYNVRSFKHYSHKATRAWNWNNFDKPVEEPLWKKVK